MTYSNSMYLITQSTITHQIQSVFNINLNKFKCTQATTTQKQINCKIRISLTTTTNG